MSSRVDFDVETTFRLSESLWREGNYREARAVLRRSLPEQSELSADVVIGISVMLNIIEQSAENYTAAIRVLNETETLVKVCRVSVLRGKWCNTKATTCVAVRDYETALPLYEQAAEDFERGKALNLAAAARNNIGSLFLRLNQPDLARNYIVRALRECEDAITRAQFRSTFARLLCAERRFDEARIEAQETAEYLLTMGEQTFADEALKTLGLIDLEEARSTRPRVSAETNELFG